MPPILTAMPDSFNAGTTVKYTRTIPDYPAGTNTLAVFLRGPTGGDLAATVTTNADGKSFDVAFSAASTVAIPPGNYRFLERVTVVASGEVYDICVGDVLVGLNVQTATAGAGQTWEEKTLAVVEAKLTNRMTKDMESYQIAGRTVSRIPYHQLMQIKRQLEWAIWLQRNPGEFGRTVQVDFSDSELRP